jgi:hypothetical protein
MEIINFIKDYWAQIVFLIGFLGALIIFIRTTIDGIKCSLRNDILSIYDRCKDTKKITYYQLESIKYSSELYFKLKGNSFVHDIVERVKDFELVDGKEK